MIFVQESLGTRLMLPLPLPVVAGAGVWAQILHGSQGHDGATGKLEMGWCVNRHTQRLAESAVMTDQLGLAG